MVEMSQRQRALYKALRQRVSITELLAQASNLNDTAGAKSLMNLVMQFRKVCSHPDLFERADVVSPFYFGSFARSGRLTREGDGMYCPDSGRNDIAPALPRLVWEEKLDRPAEESDAGDRRWVLGNLMSIWNPDWVARRLKEERAVDEGYGFLRVTGTTPGECVRRAKRHPLVALVEGAEGDAGAARDGVYER
jgi:DNA helicase INO80